MQNLRNYYDFSSTYAFECLTSNVDDCKIYGLPMNLFQRVIPCGGKCLIQVELGSVFGHKFLLKIHTMGPHGSTTRDDQESLLNVVISNVEYRKNDTTRYSAGDTQMGMDGYHYWSYQGATNADNDGLGLITGLLPSSVQLPMTAVVFGLKAPINLAEP